MPAKRRTENDILPQPNGTRNAVVHVLQASNLQWVCHTLVHLMNITDNRV